MGNSDSKAENDMVTYLKQNYVPENTNHPDYRFGKCEVWRKRNLAAGNPEDPDLLLVKEKWSMNKQEFDKYNERMLRRQELANVPGGEEYLSNLKAHTHSNENQWCANYFKNYSAYEYHHENLAEELKRRRRLPQDDPVDKYMPEPEVWYIVRSLAGGATALRSKGLYHGDIQPRHVLVNPEGGVKLIEAPLINQYFTGYNRMALEADYHAALSPEQLEVLRMQRPDVKKGYSQADEVYSIGITSLSAGTNNPITSFYDYNNYTVNQQAINQNLGAMRNLGYSDELVNTIASMLQQDPDSRATLDEINGIANRPHQIVKGYEIGRGPGPRTSQPPRAPVVAQRPSNVSYGPRFSNPSYASNSYAPSHYGQPAPVPVQHRPAPVQARPQPVPAQYRQPAPAQYRQPAPAQHRQPIQAPIGNYRPPAPQGGAQYRR